MTNTIIEQRLAALRDVMRRESIDAFIFPSTDPHNGEYVPEHWEGRKWISGFNGSAGTAVVTMDAAALWTDSRYFLAAAEQLEGTEFKLMKERVEGTPSIIKWLGQKLSFVSSPVVGIDGMVNSEASVAELIAGLRNEGGITVRTNFDPLGQIWTDRPPVPQNKITVHPLEYAGESCASKLERIRAMLKDMNACGMLAAALDDIAWTLNLRGSDVHCNPVFVSYLLITSRHATLFVDGAKLDDGVREYLKGEGVDTADYNKVKDAVIDTWEHEPQINLRLMDRAWIATPHIAGYSADGKANADNMVISGLCRHFGISVPCIISPPELPQDFVAAADPDDLSLQFYNPLDDSSRLKASPESFEELRGNYPLRRESAPAGRA